MRKPAPTMSSAHPHPTVRPEPSAASCSAPPGTPRIATLADAGRIIRAKRRALDLRIDDAADFSGVSVDLLSRLENGKTGVSTVSLLKVLDALGLAMLILDKRELPAATEPDAR